eukprot:5546512-Amphidinium_carterae.2
MPVLFQSHAQAQSSVVGFMGVALAVLTMGRIAFRRGTSPTLTQTCRTTSLLYHFRESNGP